MRTQGSAEGLERRRRRAVELFLDGESPEDSCRIPDASKSALYGWVKNVRENGPEALAARKRTVPRRLNDGQLAQLVLAIQQGSVAHEWANDRWTGERVATLIQRLFGVVYTPDHVRVLLREALHWTSQKSERRGRERDEEEIERWRTREFPRKKKRKNAARTSWPRTFRLWANGWKRP